MGSATPVLSSPTGAPSSQGQQPAVAPPVMTSAEFGEWMNVPRSTRRRVGKEQSTSIPPKSAEVRQEKCSDVRDTEPPDPGRIDTPSSSPPPSHISKKLRLKDDAGPCQTDVEIIDASEEFGSSDEELPQADAEGEPRAETGGEYADERPTTEGPISPCSNYRDAVSKKIPKESLWDFEDEVECEEGDIIFVEGEYDLEIDLSDAFQRHLDKPWQKAVIIKLLGLTIGYKALCSRLNSLWKPKGAVRVIDLVNDFYIVRSEKEEDSMQALTNGPWQILGSALSVQPWYPNFRAADGRVTRAVLWVQFPGNQGSRFDILSESESLGQRVINSDPPQSKAPSEVAPRGNQGYSKSKGKQPAKLQGTPKPSRSAPHSAVTLHPSTQTIMVTHNQLLATEGVVPSVPTGSSVDTEMTDASHRTTHDEATPMHTRPPDLNGPPDSGLFTKEQKQLVGVPLKKQPKKVQILSKPGSKGKALALLNSALISRSMFVLIGRLCLLLWSPALAVLKQLGSFGGWDSRTLIVLMQMDFPVVSGYSDRGQLSRSSPKASLQQFLWSNLCAIADSILGLWVLGGDFNAILSSSGMVVAGSNSVLITASYLIWGSMASLPLGVEDYCGSGWIVFFVINPFWIPFPLRWSFICPYCIRIIDQFYWIWLD
ncbi:hypothetical protein Tsubulata_001829 [Turnera subulata]|uniref:DUF4283 domain-containing protein n=1 Tax=Turnera subulata TaxID=218843 RepID=A0A9Q0JI25_9ROSI|nr:hypothetical protein Tsubulata_001829 [Turnera subulata]